MSINENSTFSTPPPADPVAQIAQDNEIFHRARLVNTACFMQVILRDYVGAILGMVRDGSAWRLNPLEVTTTRVISLISLRFNLTRLPGILTILSHPEAKGMPSPSNSTCYIGGMRARQSRTRRGPRRFSRDCSRGKNGMRYEGFTFSVIS